MTITFDYSDLDQFTGTTAYHKHWISPVKLTDGVAFMATHGCGWLIDAVLSHQHNPTIGALEFQAWRLAVRADSSCELICDDGNGRLNMLMQLIGYTDVPRSWKLKLWLVDGVLMVPSEY